MNGRSQAVRLPAEFRFKTNEVFIRRTSEGDVVLSTKPEKKSLKEIYAQLDAAGIPDDFIADRDTRPAPDRELL